MSDTTQPAAQQHSCGWFKGTELPRLGALTLEELERWVAGVQLRHQIYLAELEAQD
ncbi:hypothetical protein ACWEKM_33870 [Streptomyces sp. NPDC004752]